VDRYWELNRYPGNRAATGHRFATYANRTRDVSKIATIKTPTLILWGAEDKLTPASGADWFEQQIKGSSKIVYPGIGHIPMEETPDKSAADLDAFLSKGVATSDNSPSIASTP